MKTLIEQARNFLKLKEKKKRDSLYLKHKRAKMDFNKIIKMIIKKYSPLRIYQWGSLLNRKNFSEISDIDIAVEGIKNAENFFNLYSDAWEITNFPLHLVEIEKIHPMYAKWIKKDGKIVYEIKKTVR